MRTYIGQNGKAIKTRFEQHVPSSRLQFKYHLSFHSFQDLNTCQDVNKEYDIELSGSSISRQCRIKSC